MLGSLLQYFYTHKKYSRCKSVSLLWKQGNHIILLYKRNQVCVYHDDESMLCCLDLICSVVLTPAKKLFLK